MESAFEKGTIETTWAVKWLQICRPLKIGPTTSSPERVTKAIRDAALEEAAKVADKFDRMADPSTLKAYRIAREIRELKEQK